MIPFRPVGGGQRPHRQRPKRRRDLQPPHGRDIRARIRAGGSACELPTVAGVALDFVPARLPRSARPRNRSEADRRADPGLRSSSRGFRTAGDARVPACETNFAHGRARSGREVGAALAAPTRQHRPTAAGPHAETKAVLLLPLPVVGLVRPLHAWPPRVAPAAVVGARSVRAPPFGPALARTDKRVYGVSGHSSNPPRPRRAGC